MSALFIFLKIYVDVAKYQWKIPIHIFLSSKVDVHFKLGYMKIHSF